MSDEVKILDAQTVEDSESHSSAALHFNLERSARRSKHVARDVSWHPDYPTIVASSWDNALVKYEFDGYLGQ